MVARTLIVRVLFGILLYSGHGIAFSTNRSVLQQQSRCRTPASMTTCQNWLGGLGDLWEEVIEFSTYGPAERKLLKAKRDKAASEAMKKDGGDISMDSFQQAQQKLYGSKTTNGGKGSNESSSSSSSSSPSQSIARDDSLSLESFQAAVASSDEKEKSSDEDIDFDGYKLRDLLVEKWGVPLDIDFQRGYGGTTVYCTILPVAFGSKRCRHESELNYLMHLQAVVETLKKYDNLDKFIFFVQTTNKAPKPGVQSAPYLMKLSDEQLKQIL
jgi:hypothetical protein